MAIFIGRKTTQSEAPAGIAFVDGSSPHVRELLAAAQGSAPPAGGEKTEPVAEDSGSSNALPNWQASVIAIALFIPALLLAAKVVGDGKGPTFTAVEGIGAFALFYVAAQAAERAVEVLMPVWEAIASLGGTSKSDRVKERDAALAAAITNPTATVTETKDSNADPETAAKAAAVKQAAVDQAKANRTLVAFAGTGALGMLLCAYLTADFLTAVGVKFTTSTTTTVPDDFPTQLLMMAVTGLVLGGGSKALHDTISNISKSSEKKSTPSATGGAGGT